jgi:hypothetical protein
MGRELPNEEGPNEEGPNEEGPSEERPSEERPRRLPDGRTIRANGGGDLRTQRDREVAIKGRRTEPSTVRFISLVI